MGFLLRSPNVSTNIPPPSLILYLDDLGFRFRSFGMVPASGGTYFKRPSTICIESGHSILNALYVSFASRCGSSVTAGTDTRYESDAALRKQAANVKVFYRLNKTDI